MKLKTDNFFNDISESIRAFFPEEKIEQCENDADFTVTQHIADGMVVSSAQFGSFSGSHSEKADFFNKTQEKRIKKHSAKMAAYNALKKATKKELPWGSLTGIRPTKLVYFYGDNAQEILKNEYDLPKDKISLLRRICNNQSDYYNIEDDEIDIYIGIPFCRTRCSYCSFSSTDSTKGEKLMVPYVDALLKEMDFTSDLLKRLNKRVRCVYIGGGTPTALTEDLFEKMMLGAKKNFKCEKEFTVEAGRPDTITRRKLEIMKGCGVDRISINPQSMNASTLEKIGRSHSPEEIEECFALAREIGFNTINADVIAGLEGETPDMFFHTLEKVLALSAENITVHTLALKRGSIMFERGVHLKNEEAVKEMVEGALKILTQKGYEPYYLYRQKYMTGNFENIGYAKKGHIGVYNIDIMEETSSIAALGCGGVSKRIFRSEERIERAFNFKSIYEYIERIDEEQMRKNALFG